jgi:carbamoyltransferase
MTKHIVAAYWGHDSVLCFWNDVTKTFHTLEIEKVTGIKHYRGHYRREEEADIYKKCIEIAEKEFGIPNDYHAFVIGGFNDEEEWMVFNVPDDKELFLRCFANHEAVRKAFNVKNIVAIPGHHNFHAMSAFQQSPFDKAVSITMDGGGDDGFQFVRTIPDRKTILESKLSSFKIRELSFGRQYNRCARWVMHHIVKNTPNHSDLAGKVMGASAYGSTSRGGYVKGRALMEDNKEWWNRYTRETEWLRYYIGDRDRTHMEWRERKLRIIKVFSKTPEHFNPWSLMTYPISWEQECDIALGIQDKFVTMALNWIKDQIKEQGINLDEYDRNVVFSGGCALNVLFNNILQKELDVNLYVPPNPTDVGLAFGILTSYMIKNDMEFEVPPYSMTYNGSTIRDKEKLPDYIESHNGRKGTLDEVADLLKNNKVIGFVQGRIENGARALGNRSLLANPKGNDAKDRVNKVKRRESYRPFAPICKLEDAPKYFDGPRYDNLAHMNVALRTRDEYLDEVRAATHVDGTARVQTVTYEQNPNIYTLLDKFDGVLLNTSFNLAGKPILNTYEEAFYQLDNTPLDNLVIIDDNNDIWIF